MLFSPNRFIRLLCANEALFLSSVSSLLGYNGTPLRPQSDKTSVQKQSDYHHNANDRFGLKQRPDGPKVRSSSVGIGSGAGTEALPW